MLGVNHILEGSVRKSGDRVRVTAQLINPEDGSHLWSETYDRTVQDVFEIHEELARTVAKALQLTLDTKKAEGKVVRFMAPTVCMCSTMQRIDPQHLAWVLENLAEGRVVNQIEVPPHEATLARIALERMLAAS